MTRGPDPLFTVFSTTQLERDIALLDRVKEKFALTDRLLGEMLGINKTVLSDIRRYAKALSKGGPVPGTLKPRMLTSLQRVRAFDRLGYAWARDALTLAFPDSVRDEMLKTDNARTAAQMDGEGPGAADVDHVGVAQ